MESIRDTTDTHPHFYQIRDAIGFIYKNYSDQPSLEQMAEAAHLSPYHFQRVFTAWAGVSPKKFLQYITLQHAKEMLKRGENTLGNAAFATGLSGTSRLHDLFVSVEGMTPGEYKQGGSGLSIHYQFTTSLFGPVLVASTSKGVCYLAFADNREVAMQELVSHFPNAAYSQQQDAYQQAALQYLQADTEQPHKVQLHIKATPFQLKVWELLLRVPAGRACSYGQLAQALGQPGASRAVGTAVADNPIAFLIPCHRVIRNTGVIGEYHWGPDRKLALLGWESARAAEH